jgi:ribosome recycling factor
MLDHIQVDYYGTPTQIAQVANVTLLDARTLGVQPWEKKMLAVVEKAIRESDLGLNPSTQGDLIRVPTPPLTEERRKEMVKLVKSEAEDGKIAIRNIRRDANEVLKKLLKDKTISEDDERRAQDDVQKLTDKFVAEVDKLVAEKEKEILTV